MSWHPWKPKNNGLRSYCTRTNLCHLWLHGSPRTDMEWNLKKKKKIILFQVLNWLSEWKNPKICKVCSPAKCIFLLILKEHLVYEKRGTVLSKTVNMAFLPLSKFSLVFKTFQNLTLKIWQSSTVHNRFSPVHSFNSSIARVECN